MKTKPPGPATRPGLPPPPAPTARDANPWTMSSGASSRSGATAQHEGAGRRFRPDRSRARPGGERPLRVVPFAILGLIAAAGVNLALQATREGDPESAVGAALVVLLIAFVLFRRLSRKR